MAKSDDVKTKKAATGLKNGNKSPLKTVKPSIKAETTAKKEPASAGSANNKYQQLVSKKRKLSESEAPATNTNEAPNGVKSESGLNCV